MENEMNPGNHQLSITVYHSGQYGNAQNCTYPYSSTGSTPDELKKLFCSRVIGIPLKMPLSPQRMPSS